MSVAVRQAPAAKLPSASGGASSSPINPSPRSSTGRPSRSAIRFPLTRSHDSPPESSPVGTRVLGPFTAACRARAHPRCIYLHEPRLLDSGGGIANALAKRAIGPGPFFVVNGDSLWLDGAEPALHRLARAFDPRAMDAMLLLLPTAAATGYAGRGDFSLDEAGRLAWPEDEAGAPFVYIGVQVLHPRAFERFGQGAYGLREVWQVAIEDGRAFGLCHDGAWFHLSTPADLDVAENSVRS